MLQNQGRKGGDGEKDGRNNCKRKTCNVDKKTYMKKDKEINEKRNLWKSKRMSERRKVGRKEGTRKECRKKHRDKKGERNKT